MISKIRISETQLPDHFLQAMEQDEADGAWTMSTRTDTLTLTVEGADGSPIGYAVFGVDQGDMVAIYFARSFVPMFGAMMMKQFFGVAQVMGKPLRMHINSLRDLKVRARMFGADVALEGVDADGLLHGIFA